MASGVCGTTTRFTGLVIGIAGLGVVLYLSLIAIIDLSKYTQKSPQICVKEKSQSEDWPLSLNCLEIRRFRTCGTSQGGTRAGDCCWMRPP
ncbi:hypothetical protein OKW42_002845 [Paraburkholderia sp. WC7.3d]